MARVLVPTQTRDVHSFAVQRALRELGHDCVRIFGSDYPTLQVSSLRFGRPDLTQWEIKASETLLADAPFDTVWRRRLRFPYVPDGSLADDDMWAAASESRMYFNSLWQVIAPGATWVNEADAARRATSKGLQLSIAQRLGMTVPVTLMSNDPEEVRAFVGEQQPNEVIYKMFFSAGWTDGGRESIVTTTKITAEDLPSDHAIRCVPGIYQRYVPKAYELRVTFMGAHYVALKLHSQQNPTSKTDWRYTPMDSYPSELCEISSKMYDQCRAIMRELGIVFAAFDFVVTPDGEEVFLELNESGQFLFVEKAHPHANLLQSFAEFLTKPSASFTPSESSLNVSFYRYLEDPKFVEEFAAADAEHLTEPLPWQMPEALEQRA